jgi:hypothetical protein
VFGLDAVSCRWRGSGSTWRHIATTDQSVHRRPRPNRQLQRFYGIIVIMNASIDAGSSDAGISLDGGTAPTDWRSSTLAHGGICSPRTMGHGYGPLR